MPRRRSGKLKVQHHFLEGLEGYLEEIQGWEVVESIIPGRIVRQNRGRGSRGLFLKYRTLSGYKLLYKSGTSVQEVFVVCRDYEVFEKLFRERFG
ncbi:MAG TPA: hypothetical protein ENJ61_00035 [Aquifex aeolicus]|uniref:Metal-binding protein n=1 Tax=Aquifex aeolicus TaxID=63363 RepID=A0A7C5Q1G5_AQUAO|nr:hypothetical protein [Aquifex aeolicus]